MNWRNLLPWRRHRHTDTTDEARAALARAESNDAAITELGCRLAEIRHANHFSQMVAVAITRKNAKEA